MKKILLFSFLFLGINSYGQYIYPVKVDNCKIDRFCLDCGDTLAGYDQKAFTKLEQELNKELDLNKLTGRIGFQVLVAPNKTGCVISHTDESNSTVTKKIIKKLNKFKKWTPSITDGKIELKTSINVVFEVQNNTISGKIVRVDFTEFEKNYDQPTAPKILNKTYQYKNENLANYTISVWDTRNSNLLDNDIMGVAVDNSGLVWLISYFELLTFNGQEFKEIQYSDPFNDNESGYSQILIDEDNIVWLYGNEQIYSIQEHKWQKHNTGLSKETYVIRMSNNLVSKEIFVSSPEGGAIYKNQKWNFINQKKIKELPSTHIYLTQRDSNNRLWIGTSSGTIVMDKHNKPIPSDSFPAIIKKKTITNFDEDKKGNFFLSLYDFETKKREEMYTDFIIYRTDGSYTKYTLENSGIATNTSLTKVLYDNEDDILWIATFNAGLIRYDLKKNTWENYHSKNSMLPTSKITDMAFDKNYNLYLATDQGLVKLEKR
ncbi:hypothetical protein HXZ81_16270 [Myroides odoratimimus]|uniref:two-component regulator propeller domain-containing protein n=1 Tax=Myroides odoratimimus TaxID=76832 RepID=UPI002578173B|nr:two-component regulator propeller domain-containing protein [Myroides odoratimimus]MDM1098164.1 hypothetical protein [Myroides odoratimimus]